jgi:GT2 family glycosyltransferase
MTTRTGERVAAVVVTHGFPSELEECLATLAPQVDELVLVANLPGRPPSLPPGTRIIWNVRPLGFAANVNQGIRATSAPFVVVSNPDIVVERGAVATLCDFLSDRPRAGIVGPQLRYPDGTWQPSRRRFPTVAATVVRRTPLRLLFPPTRWQRRHYLLDDRPDEPVQADWMLGGFLVVRRRTMDALDGFDEGYRLYGEDIDLCYRAARAGWERWYVPGAVVVHDYHAVIDKRFFTVRTLWHLRGMARFVRRHPERLLALG